MKITETQVFLDYLVKVEKDALEDIPELEGRFSNDSALSNDYNLWSVYPSWDAWRGTPIHQGNPRRAVHSHNKTQIALLTQQVEDSMGNQELATRVEELKD